MGNSVLDRWKKPEGLLVLYLIFFGLLLIAWSIANQAPPAWDESWYLQTSVVLEHSLSSGTFLTTLAHAFGGVKAPLISVLPIPIYLVFGDAYASVVAVNIMLGLGTLIVLYLLTRELMSPRRALLAVVIFSTMPLFYGIARVFLVETLLTLLVVLWIYLLLKSDLFRSQKVVVALGIVLGLGMLTKVSFPLYVGVPSLYFVYLRIRTSRHNALRDLAIIIGIGAVVSSVWYAPNLITVLHYAMSAGFGNIAANYSYGNPLDPGVIARYWAAVGSLGLSTWYTVSLILALAVLLVHRLRSQLQLDRKLTSIVLLWFLVPFVIFSLGVNKDYRFMLPLLPAAAIFLAYCIGLVSQPRARRTLAAILVSVPVLLYFHMSFDMGQDAFIAVGGWPVWSSNLGYATQPDPSSWPIPRVIDVVARDARLHFSQGSEPLCLLVADDSTFNQNNFSYFGAQMNEPIVFSAVLTSSPQGRAPAMEYLGQAQYVITKTGTQGPSFTTFLNGQIDRLLQHGKLPFVKIASIPLPDGSYAIVYRRG